MARYFVTPSRSSPRMSASAVVTSTTGGRAPCGQRILERAVGSNRARPRLCRRSGHGNLPSDSPTCIIHLSRPARGEILSQRDASQPATPAPTERNSSNGSQERGIEEAPTGLHAHSERADGERGLPSALRRARDHRARGPLRRARDPEPGGGRLVALSPGPRQPLRALAEKEEVELLELDQPGLRVLGHPGRPRLRLVLLGFVHRFRNGEERLGHLDQAPSWRSHAGARRAKRGLRRRGDGLLERQPGRHHEGRLQRADQGRGEDRGRLRGAKAPRAREPQHRRAVDDRTAFS